MKKSFLERELLKRLSCYKYFIYFCGRERAWNERINRLLTFFPAYTVKI